MKTQVIVRITADIICAIHSRLIETTGGLDGVRDTNMLDMSANSPFQTFEGIDLYPTTIDKAAHLAYSLIKNHAFIDGNKRIGIAVMIIFLKSNDFNISCTNDELTSLGFGIADGTIDEGDIKNWISEHSHG
jgi:death-on-curing protein